MSFYRECSMNNSGASKETNYVHGYPKPQLSPTVRNNHLHFGSDNAGKIFLIDTE